jgi:phospholipase C
MRTPNLTVVGLSIGLAAAVGCTSGSTAGTTDTVCKPITKQNLVAAPAFSGTVFTIVMENKSQSEIIGNRKDAPYINSLADQGAVAAGYTDSFVHPSEPNYIWMVAGENFGVLDDDDPSSHHIAATSHIADQIETQGLTWKAYMESMGQPCGMGESYPYMPKHDPFVYFDDITGWNGTAYGDSTRCQQHVVDYSEFAKDLASGNVPTYVFITPDMQNDMHDGSIGQGDAWLAREVPKILASKAYQNGGVLFLTWDEGDNASDDPPMIVLSPHAKKGYVSQVAYDASSYLKTVQTLLGLESLPCNAAASTVPTMDDLFDQPIAAVTAN